MLLSPGDGCIVETPGYPPLRGLPHGFGVEPRELLRRPDEGFALDPQRFRSLLPARLAFITNLHNPSGVRSDPALLRELGAAGVVACPGEFFGMPGHLRLGWGVARPKLEAALAALAAALA